MDLELFGLRNLNFRQELTDIVALIALQLNNFTILWMFDDCTVASKFLHVQKQKEKKTVSTKFTRVDATLKASLSGQVASESHGKLRHLRN